jgi:hypothetical protein
MYLKGALSKTKSISELARFRHKLPAIWEAFKGQINDAALNRFDAAIAALHRFEEIRYPDAILAKGMMTTVDLVRSDALAGIAGPSVPEYRICVQEIDELVEAIFSSASRNPKAYLGLYHGPAREFLIKHNTASRLTTT